MKKRRARRSIVHHYYATDVKFPLLMLKVTRSRQGSDRDVPRTASIREGLTPFSAEAGGITGKSRRGVER